MLTPTGLVSEVRTMVTDLAHSLLQELDRSAHDRVELTVSVPGTNVSAEVEAEHQRRAVVTAAALPMALELLHRLTGHSYAMRFPVVTPDGDVRWGVERAATRSRAAS